jgi:ubiquinone biosynthesis protein UbiJ
MNTQHIHQRLRDSLHRGGTKATEEEVVEVTAIVLAVFAEVAAELAEVIGELAARVEALEAQS